MLYVSTRGGMPPQTFTAILLEGLAPDGGLVVPESYPRFSAEDLARLRPLGYRDLAFEVLSRYIGDIAPGELREIVDRSYTVTTFGSDEITPLTTLEPGLYLLRAANGPTLAFKDIAMQLLGNLFEHVLTQQRESLNVLGATSGDTGSSAEYAMRGKHRVAVFMLSPRGRMSPFQSAQMYALGDRNIFNIAIDGVFDDCQDIVKAVGADAAFKQTFRIGTVNSINWARVAAQIVYYFKAYFAATQSNGDEVGFAVPSGNFGNILAGYVAREMGLPICRLILATNENDVLDEFFKTGRYRVRTAAETASTSSPSMDISKASNFERFVFDLTGRDAGVLRVLWEQVERDGGFDLAGTPLAGKLRSAGFVSGRSAHADRIATIRLLAERYGIVVDPHTADGIHVGLAHRDAAIPLICIETALPVKFAATIREALGRDPTRPAAYEGLESLPQHFAVLPAHAETVKAYIAEHARG
jgi:threonine synthase